jgi:23S rRNA (adenine2503-C2)-methyltransferase
MGKIDLKGRNLTELQAFVEGLGEKKFRAAQIYGWLYAKAAKNIDEMTDVSKNFRSVLNGMSEISNLETVDVKISADGTKKFLFKLADGMKIESVLIPPAAEGVSGESRLTVCVSTQVGCPLGCKFCATGTMGFARNLGAGEIVDQIIQIQKNTGRRITNVVYMGMGEPMLNYDNVMKSADIINDDHGLNIGSRHITVSTAGYADRIRQMADEKRQIKLALSLHSLDNKKREMIMPITGKFPVDSLIDALEYYYKRTRRRPTFEYIPFEGFNDTKADVRAFERLSRRIPCKVNLIPFNPVAIGGSGLNSRLKPTPVEGVEAFANQLRKADITVMVRRSTGKDINGACGQLVFSGTEKPYNKNSRSEK